MRLKQDSGAKALFQSSSLHSFWCKMLLSYPRLSKKAIWLLMPYPSSYLCEHSFSTMVVMKTKYRNRLELESDMIVALSSTEPRIKKLVTGKQAQPSHWLLYDTNLRMTLSIFVAINENDASSYFWFCSLGVALKCWFMEWGCSKKKVGNHCSN